MRRSMERIKINGDGLEFSITSYTLGKSSTIANDF